MSTFERLLVSEPINRQARIVTSQKGVTDDRPLSHEELSDIKERLMRKHRLLKHILRITNASQHANFMYKLNKGWRQYRASTEPRAATEYVRLGREIQRMCQAQATAEESGAAQAKLLAERVAYDRWWAGLTPEQQAAVKQAAYDAKVAKRRLMQSARPVAGL